MFFAESRVFVNALINNQLFSEHRPSFEFRNHLCEMVLKEWKAQILGYYPDEKECNVLGVCFVE
jgi:hypothetical protein